LKAWVEFSDITGAAPDTTTLLRTMAGPPPSTVAEALRERATKFRSMTMVNARSRAPYTMIPGPFVSTITLWRRTPCEFNLTWMP
jgi:hypothetical protein